MFGTKISREEARQVAALGALRTNVMIADQDLVIRYINPSLTALLRDAEDELRRELPNFRMDKLIGSNIDIFHRNPAVQRNMLATLQTPHAAMISIGRRAFDLLVTPLFRQEVQIGFVVEWSDAKHRLRSRDYAAVNAALDRSMAMVEFSPEGILINANDRFCQAMGYTLDELQGRHHRIFLEPAYRDSKDYENFWAQLRGGRLVTGQFKRIGKSGNTVWIEGTYNPVLDDSGKLVKIVKLAMDTTKQVKLLADLATLIDDNFAEVEQAITLSTTEARSATVAALETTSNVQAVSASADELATSIREVSQSMATSRTATENAFDQIVAVGRNTESLAHAAQAMNGIVALIRNVASQINLLALNATIESARAGDAGKGFAVVASEVKSLAVQAASATEQIAREIEGMQGTSRLVVEALEGIRGAFTTVRDSVTKTASAVEEQSTVTQGMSQNMTAAAGVVATVSTNIGEISSAVTRVAEAMAKTKSAARVLARA